MPHGDLCFGCGQANVFGLHLEGGRFFVKQDHQGPGGRAHPGVIAAALAEAMALRAGAEAPPQRFEVAFEALPQVGTFVSVAAQADRVAGEVHAVAEAVLADGTALASAKAVFRV
jgi:acyl-coenzyme A thioesterase PaaI-like protein